VGGAGAPRDVRQRGFRARADVAEVIRLIDARVSPLPPETVALGEAAGRTLAEDVVAAADVPAFARASMDGYAVRAEDTFGATPDDPRPLRVVGDSFPARPASAEVLPGTCVRIMTGAPVPRGADAVVPFEQTEPGRDAARVTAPVAPGKHVGAAGEDIARGTLVLARGRVLRPQDLGVLSSLGVARLSAVRRPHVALLVTGDELLPAGTPPEGFRIADANSPMLAALVARDGGIAARARLVRDDRAALADALEEAAAACDCLLVTGGSSVGAEDHAPSLLAERGELSVHGVAMRPSSPAGVGFLRGRPVFLLPGNPVSSLCAYDFFAGRAVRRLAGRPPEWPYRPIELPLARKIASPLGRTDYVRVRVAGGRIDPIATSGASILSSTTRADGFVVVPRDLEGYPEGAVVTAYLY
jgi:molybdopterin molybdotransferase